MSTRLAEETVAVAGENAGCFASGEHAREMSVLRKVVELVEK